MTYEQLEFVRSVCSSWLSSIVVVGHRQQRGQEATHLVRYALSYLDSYLQEDQVASPLTPLAI